MQQLEARQRLEALGVVALLVALPSGPARAQANAEVLTPNPLRAGLSGGLDASLALQRGNMDLFDVAAAGRFQFQTLHRPDGEPALPFIASRAFVTAAARYSERLSRSFINQAFVHARWIRMWHPRVGLDVFAQYQFNEFWRLRARAVTGGGARVVVVHEPALMIWAGTGYMFEYNRIAVADGAMDAPETFEHRWTNYLVARVDLLDHLLLLQNTFYLQPRLDDLDDFRLLEEVEVMVRVTQVLSFGTTFSLIYDRRPPTGVKDTDYRLGTLVRLTF